MNGSLLPPDLRRKMESREAIGPVPHRGIGGAARENMAEAEARARAFGDAPPPPASDAPAEAKKEEEPARLEHCPGCKAVVADEWSFCARCGRDLIADRDPVAWLGVTPFTLDDVERYVFKGFIVRDVPLLGKHKLRVKSSQPCDLKDVDKYFMEGEYKDKPLSQDLYNQLHRMATVAASTFSLDDQPIGEKLADKMAWLEERGSAFVDMVTYRVAVFNRAWTRYLEDQNRVLGS